MFLCYGGSVQDLAIILCRKSCGNFYGKGGRFRFNFYIFPSVTGPDFLFVVRITSIAVIATAALTQSFLSRILDKLLKLRKMSVSWANEFPVLPADLVSAGPNFFLEPSFSYLRQSLVLCVM
jgi:hypothetical protein